MKRSTNLLRAVFLLLAAVSSAAAQSIPANSPDFFETKIRPVLIKNCYSCHTTSQMSGLRVDSQDAITKGGKRGPAIVPGNAAGSLLLQAIRQTDQGLKMPMGGKLTDAEINDFASWIEAGAVWPKSAAVNAAADGKYVIYPEQKEFWSLVPLHQPKIPAVKDTKWPKTDIDRLVLARLEKEKVVQQFAGDGGGMIQFGLNSVWLTNTAYKNVWRIDPKRIAATLGE